MFLARQKSLEEFTILGRFPSRRLRLYCDYNEACVCNRCGHVANTRTHIRECPQGSGTELKALLALFGIHAGLDCKCAVRAFYMDEQGCDWCEANIQEIVGWLRESAAERGLPFLDAAGRMLVRRAIANARREEARNAEEADRKKPPAV